MEHFALRLYYMIIPPKLPETGPFRRLYGWLNQLREAVTSQRLIETQGMQIQRTRLGTIAKPIARDENDVSVPRWG